MWVKENCNKSFTHTVTKLTEIAIKSAKPGVSIRKLSDGNGLVLLIHPNGSKYWTIRYRYLGKPKSLSLGVYPKVGLADARRKLADARQLLESGQDPSEARKAFKRQALISAENNFEAIAREWIVAKSPGWTPDYTKTITRRLESDIFPKLGARPIKAIVPPELLSVVRVVEQRGALDLAHRLMNYCGQIFMFGIATGRAERNPVPDLRGALKSPVVKHRAYLKEIELPVFLKKLDTFDGGPITRLAFDLMLVTFVRTIEMRAAYKTEIHWKKAEWRIPPERMKMKVEHIVPLSRQAILILRELEKLTGGSPFLFPNEHNPAKFMSENTMLYALYRMGYHSKATVHGFRSTASTILNENGFNRDVIERQLAHTERNTVRAAYNHAQYLPERRKMMQWWADYLDKLTEKK